MLSKEEIENLLKNISQGFRKIPQVENILYPLDINQFQKLSEYIAKLESDKQKLIEKLEKTRNNLEKDGFIGYSDEIQESLKILKGENE